MRKKFTMTLVEDPTGQGRPPGACTQPDEPMERVFLFWFRLVPSESVGTPQEMAKTRRHRLKVMRAANRLVAWGLYDPDRDEDLSKLAFWLGKTEMEKLMEKADLGAEESVLVHTANCGKHRPYDPATLPRSHVGAVFELEVERSIGWYREPEPDRLAYHAVKRQ